MTSALVERLQQRFDSGEFIHYSDTKETIAALTAQAAALAAKEAEIARLRTNWATAVSNSEEAITAAESLEDLVRHYKDAAQSAEARLTRIRAALAPIREMEIVPAEATMDMIVATREVMPWRCWIKVGELLAIYRAMVATSPTRNILPTLLDAAGE